MKRRDFLRTTAGAAAGPALLGTGVFAKTADRPNIVFILTDDHRWDAFQLRRMAMGLAEPAALFASGEIKIKGNFAKFMELMKLFDMGM